MLVSAILLMTIWASTGLVHKAAETDEMKVTCLILSISLQGRPKVFTHDLTTVMAKDFGERPSIKKD